MSPCLGHVRRYHLRNGQLEEGIPVVVSAREGPLNFDNTWRFSQKDWIQMCASKHKHNGKLQDFSTVVNNSKGTKGRCSFLNTEREYHFGERASCN